MKDITVDNLNDVMEFDHVIRVNADGSVDQYPANPPLLPEFYVDSDGKDTIEDNGAGWTFLTGYTGQHGYNGPVLHPSEFIGGGLARDILAAPGLYGVLEVRDGDTYEYPEGDAIGWVVAHIPAS